MTASYSAGPGDMRAALELIAAGRIDPAPLVSHRLPLEETARALELQRSADRPEGRRRAVRAAILHGPEDLRVEEVPEPEGEVIVEVEAATTCGTDVKMWRYGHRILPPYPCPFGHETAGVRADTGERVLVSDSVACGSCEPCRRRAGPDLPATRPGCSADSPSESPRPAAALHRVPDGLPAAAAAMAEPLAAAVHAVDARRATPPTSGSWAAARWG